MQIGVNNMYLVYKHITPNGKIYVGQTNNLKKRWGANGKNYSRCPHFYNAIKKYGWNNIEHIVVYTELTKSEADYLEKYLIRYYNSDDSKYGYNLTAGGEGGVQNEAARKKMSEAKKGKPSPRKGSKMSEEQKEKISKSLYASNSVPRKPIICIETNTYFQSITEAAKAVNRDDSSLIKAIKKGSLSAGFHWKYAS